MYLKDYLANLTNALNEYDELGMIAASEFSTDIRSDKIGVLSGKIAFIDGSTLFFKEYLDLRYRVDKKTYSFHYQDATRCGGFAMIMRSISPIPVFWNINTFRMTSFRRQFLIYGIF